MSFRFGLSNQRCTDKLQADGTVQVHCMHHLSAPPIDTQLTLTLPVSDLSLFHSCSQLTLATADSAPLQYKRGCVTVVYVVAGGVHCVLLCLVELTSKWLSIWKDGCRRLPAPLGTPPSCSPDFRLVVTPIFTSLLSPRLLFAPVLRSARCPSPAGMAQAHSTVVRATTVQYICRHRLHIEHRPRHQPQTRRQADYANSRQTTRHLSSPQPHQRPNQSGHCSCQEGQCTAHTAGE